MNHTLARRDMLPRLRQRAQADKVARRIAAAYAVAVLIVAAFTVGLIA